MIKTGFSRMVTHSRGPVREASSINNALSLNTRDNKQHTLRRRRPLQIRNKTNVVRRERLRGQREMGSPHVLQSGNRRDGPRDQRVLVENPIECRDEVVAG